jgi:hypothetical protein
MNINVNGNSFDMNKENTFVMEFENDLLDGIYIDMDEEYVFVSKHTEVYEMLVPCCLKEDVFLIQSGEVDLDEPPYLWVVSALGRTIAEAAEKIANG